MGELDPYENERNDSHIFQARHLHMSQAIDQHKIDTARHFNATNTQMNKTADFQLKMGESMLSVLNSGRSSTTFVRVYSFLSDNICIILEFDTRLIVFGSRSSRLKI
eukprot:427852_1